MKPVRHCDADDVLMLLFLSANVIFLSPRNLPCVLFDHNHFFLCFPLTNFSDRFWHCGKSSEKFPLFLLVFISFTIFVDCRVFSHYLGWGARLLLGQRTSESRRFM